MSEWAVPIDVAIDMLREREPGWVHTFRSAPGVLLGADWKRDELVEAMRRSPMIQVAGSTAKAFGHGLVIDSNGPLFIETKELH